MITTTRVWNIDNQLVVADTIEEAIAIRKEYDKDYYDHSTINEVKLVTIENCLTIVNFAIKKEEK
jgi:hypothetical protein